VNSAKSRELLSCWLIEKVLTIDCTKHWIVSANAGTYFVVSLFRVAYIVEFGSRSKHAATKPDSISLHVVRNDCHIKRHCFDFAAAQLFTSLDSVVYRSLDISGESLSKIFEHSRTTREHDVLVKTTSHINGTSLDGIIYYFWQRCQEITAEYFRVEKNLWSQKSLIAYVTRVWLFL